MRNFSARDRLKVLAGSAAFALTSCGSSGTNSGVTPPLVATPPPPPTPPATFVPASGQFRDAFNGKFLVGAAIQARHVESGSEDGTILADQFNSVTAEYQMKADIIAPAEGSYDWLAADQIVDFAEDNGLQVRGHALLWYRSTPDWMLSGTPAEVRTKLQTYITDVVSRYRGRIYAWDVVNEVITDDDMAASPYRQSIWWAASGGNADYIDWAFEAARAADPDCKLYINDYNTELSAKRGRLINVVRDLLSRGIPVEGVGHQMHINLGTTASQVLEAIDAFDNEFMGLEQHVTELDISVYQDPGSCFSNMTGCQADYGATIPANVLNEQAELYRAVFNGFAERPSLNSVSLWGVSDGESWLNDWPVTRTNAPLLWDRDRNAKSALQAILDPDFTP